MIQNMIDYAIMISDIIYHKDLVNLRDADRYHIYDFIRYIDINNLSEETIQDMWNDYWDN